MLDQIETLTVSEAAKLLQVSRGLVLRLIADQRLLAYKIGTGKGHYRIPVQAFEAYLEDCKTIETKGGAS